MWMRLGSRPKLPKLLHSCLHRLIRKLLGTGLTCKKGILSCPEGSRRPKIIIIVSSSSATYCRNTLQPHAQHELPRFDSVQGGGKHQELVPEAHKITWQPVELQKTCKDTAKAGDSSTGKSLLPRLALVHSYLRTSAKIVKFCCFNFKCQKYDETLNQTTFCEDMNKKTFGSIRHDKARDSPDSLLQ